MTRDELTILLDTLGAPGPAWREDQLRQMRVLVEHDAAAAADVAAAQRLESQFEHLRQATEAVPNADLKHRILQAAAAQTDARRTDNRDQPREAAWIETFDRWWSVNLWRPALAACVPLVVGLGIGALHGQAEQDAFTAEYAAYLYSPLQSQANDASALDWLGEDEDLP